MVQIKSLAIGLLAIVVTAPAASAVTPENFSTSNSPAENLHAQVKVNIGIGIGTEAYPQPVYYPQPQPRERVIVVERNTQTTYYNGRSRWSESRGRKEGWYKRGKYKSNRDRDDD